MFNNLLYNQKNSYGFFNVKEAEKMSDVKIELSSDQFGNYIIYEKSCFM
jgi:hypothetical protein